MAEQDSHWYKKWFENLQETPPEGTWDNIANQLDVDEVWDRVAQALPEPIPQTHSKPQWIRNISSFILATFILLFLSTPVPPSFEGIHQSKAYSINENQTDLIHRHSSTNPDKDLPQSENDQKIQSSTDQNYFTEESSETQNDDFSTSRNKSIPREKKSNLNNQKGVAKSTKQANSLISEKLEKESENLSATENRKLLEKLPLLPPEYSGKETVTYYPVEVEISKNQPVVVNEDNKKGISWEVGLVSSINNTWLVNNETLEGLRSEALTNTRTTFRTEAGVLVRAGKDEKAQIQAEFYVFSQIGQRYQDYYNALYQTKDISMHYQKLQLLYRRRIVNRPSFLSLHILGGAYLSRLQSARVSIGSKTEDVKDQYLSLDYGLVGGIDTEFPIAGNLSINPGLRVNYSPHNIYKGTSVIPAGYNKTKNLSFGVSVGLVYKIRN